MGNVEDKQISCPPEVEVCEQIMIYIPGVQKLENEHPGTPPFRSLQLLHFGSARKKVEEEKKKRKGL